MTGAGGLSYTPLWERELNNMRLTKQIEEEAFERLRKLLRQEFAIVRQAQASSLYCIPGNITIAASRGALEAVSRVLNTQELLDMVLSKVPAHDLVIKVQAVCRVFRDTVKSKALDRATFRSPDFTLLPVKGSCGIPIFEVLPFSIPHITGVCSGIEGCRHFAFQIPAPHLPRTAATLRSRLISRPPVTYLQFDPEGLAFEDDDSAYDLWCQNDAGITYGDLFDLIDRVEKKVEEAGWAKELLPYECLGYADSVANFDYFGEVSQL